MVEAIRGSGWNLPGQIAGYTESGVPFAYPPLLFYAVAGLVEATSVDLVALELDLPGLISIAYLSPTGSSRGNCYPRGGRRGWPPSSTP